MPAQSSLRTLPAVEVSKRRVFGAGFVVTLHVAMIYALLVGLAPPEFVRVITPPFIVRLISNPPVTPPLPPPPVTTHIPDAFTPPVAPPMEFDTPPPGQTITVGVGNPPPVAPSVAARGIAGTHTTPDYPPISRRLNEAGVVSLRVTISETGAVSDVSVIRSSGYARLDQAAASWVKSHWRYQPAIQDGRPVASTAEALVKFELK